MRYLEVAVTCRTSRGAGSFHYSLASDDVPAVGALVWVPFGQRLVQGIVLGISDDPPPFPTRDVASVPDPTPALVSSQIQLARWIAGHYCCSLSTAVALMLPAELRQKAVATYSLTGEASPTTLTGAEAAVAAALAAGPRPAEDLRQGLSGREAARALRALELLGVVKRTWTVAPPKARPKKERTVQLALASEALAPAIASLRRARSQAALLRWLAANAGDGEPVAVAAALEGSGANQAALLALARHGYVTIGEREVLRSPLGPEDLEPVPLPALTSTQAAALRAIVNAVRERQRRVLLLHGVTGSGKGEIYLHALAETLRLGKRAIVLVPEIALTPQTVRRFAARFGGRVAVLHSRLSPGEHLDEWRRIRAGEAKIVIGSRSAILAPVDDLGLIVVDEEHEWSYKQSEKDPRYHARDVAIALGEIAGAPVVLGSATPDVATYYRATRAGEYTLLELPERVEGGGLRPATRARAGAEAERPAVPPVIPMPTVRVVDLRGEGKADERKIFSPTLRRAIASALDEGSQVVLFLNRRGTATFVVCRVCGYVAQCRRCDLPMVYHAGRNQLLCHHCNRPAPVPPACPACWSRQIGYFGVGTERVEAEVRRLFPEARVMRWDRDTARGKSGHGRLLARFLNGEADILVGTQMIAKGLDLPQVALVGVVVADTALQLPDFRAVERTFQLLMQVAGRAGRGARPGRVVVQTFNPDHYAIQAAREHNYQKFFAQEIRFRAEHNYPPYADLARLVYYNTSETRCRRETERLASYLEDEIERRGLPNLDIIGPAPAFHRRLRGRFRWQIIVRGVGLQSLLRNLALPAGWALDIDPVSLL